LVIKPLFTFYVPNAFTPNNDGVNDLFFGEGTGIKKYEMSIYNRWGEKIFHSQDQNEKWNGGVTEWYVQNDVYQYVFKITDVLNKIHLIKGHVTVIR
jgi:gliding motility-associated-like protein